MLVLMAWSYLTRCMRIHKIFYFYFGVIWMTCLNSKSSTAKKYICFVVSTEGIKSVVCLWYKRTSTRSDDYTRILYMYGTRTWSTKSGLLHNKATSPRSTYAKHGFQSMFSSNGVDDSADMCMVSRSGARLIEFDMCFWQQMADISDIILCREWNENVRNMFSIRYIFSPMHQSTKAQCRIRCQRYVMVMQEQDCQTSK